MGFALGLVQRARLDIVLQIMLATWTLAVPQQCMCLCSMVVLLAGPAGCSLLLLFQLLRQSTCLLLLPQRSFVAEEVVCWLWLNVSPVQMLCDNQAAMKLIKHPIASMRSKHIDVQHHFVRERCSRGEVAFQYCETGEMVADCMTKALPMVKF
jgi:hypothetical protein